MVRKKTSLEIDDELWVRVKLHCVANRIEIGAWLESVIRKEIGWATGMALQLPLFLAQTRFGSNKAPEMVRHYEVWQFLLMQSELLLRLNYSTTK